MPKAREDEIRYMRLLRPMLKARIGTSLLMLVGMGVAVFHYHVFSLFSLILTAVGLIVVNILSFYFIKKDYPVRAFAMMNGMIFIIIIVIGVYYSGAEKSPFMFAFLVMILIVAIISNSKTVTTTLSILSCAAFDIMIMMQMHGILEPREFFMKLNFTVFDETKLKYSVLLWNIIMISCGVFFGYMSALIGRVRYELQDAIDENIRLQGIVRKLVSNETWAEASNAAKHRTDVLEEHTAEKTIMFTDIVGFSAISERIKPGEVIAMLNSHFDLISEIIYDHGGDIDKFIGDAVMAVFDDATDAVDAAIAIQEEIDVEAKKADFNDPVRKVRVRIGINTGEVVHGNMGGTRRGDRSLIGDAVNIAQRLESMAGTGCILVSAATYRAVGRRKYKFRRVGLVRIKGKKKKVAAYSLDPVAK